MDNCTPMTGTMIQEPEAPIEVTAPEPDRLSPTLKPISEQQRKYRTIRQGQATNALTKIVSGKKSSTTIDPITGEATITQGNMTVTLPNFLNLAGLRTTTYQLLDALMTRFTETGAKSPVIALSLTDYMQMRGLKDRKAAREQVEQDLETLFNARISFREKQRRKDGKNFLDIRIVDSKGIKNGIITASFGSAFYHILLTYGTMPHPAQCLTINSKRNPNSYALLRKIAEHKHMNAGKKNEDLIAVSTLLEVAPAIPTYEEVIKSNDRHTNDRIIEVFERDMDALEDTFTWQYCHTNNTPLTDEELHGMNYELFATLLVCINWKDYPDQTARLAAAEERRAETQKKAAARKKPTRKKQPPTDAPTDE